MTRIVATHYRYQRLPSTKIALWAPHQGERKRT
jgi:hypothetical protein